MLGGYNVESLIGLLEDDAVGGLAADGLSKTLLMFNAKHDVIELSKTNIGSKMKESNEYGWYGLLLPICLFLGDRVWVLI